MKFHVSVKTADELSIEAKNALRVRIYAAVEEHITAQAQALQYTSATHLASYVSSTNPEWAEQAKAFVAWRDQVWATALAMMQAAETATDALNVDQVTAAMPEYPVKAA